MIFTESRSQRIWNVTQKYIWVILNSKFCVINILDILMIDEYDMRTVIDLKKHISNYAKK